MKYRVGTKPVYEARKNLRHVKFVSLAKQFFRYMDYESTKHSAMENKTYEELEYEANEV